MNSKQDTGDADVLADSATALEVAFGRDAENPSVCVVDGYGVQVATRSGRLVVYDGIGRHRRERVYARASHGLSRLVVFGATGHITIEALRWLEGAEVGLVVIDPSTGDVISAATRVANDDARLRRAQALSPGTETGLAVGKYLTTVKLAGQASIAGCELGVLRVAETISHLTGRLAESSTLEEIRQLEATAANLYWSAWGPIEVDFVKKDRARVPSNWLCFEGRRSAVNPGSPRNSSDPVNCLLNYCFRLLCQRP